MLRYLSDPVSGCCFPRAGRLPLLLFLVLVVIATFPGRLSAADRGPAATGSGTGHKKVFRGLRQLPKPVRVTVRTLHAAAAAGDMEAMREVLDMNELMPLVSDTGIPHAGDVIAYWRRLSADGSGLDVLAQIVAVLRTGYVVQKSRAGSALYLWPYFAALPLKSLTPAQKVELFRLAPGGEAARMLQTGTYTGYRLGIGKDGTWHFFVKSP